MEAHPVEPPAESAEPEGLPGSTELSEALAALDAIGSEPEPETETEPEAEPASEPEPETETEPEAEPASEPEPETEPEPAPDAEPEPEPDAGKANVEWPPVITASDPGPFLRPSPSAAPIPPSALRYRPVGPPSGSAGPAGRAYRRLRRIFPN